MDAFVSPSWPAPGPFPDITTASPSNRSINSRKTRRTNVPRHHYSCKYQIRIQCASALQSLGLSSQRQQRQSPDEFYMLDLRPEPAFTALHIKRSTHIPYDELASRMLELPPPYLSTLFLCHDRKDEMDAAVSFLLTKGYVVDLRKSVDLSLSLNSGSKDVSIDKGKEMYEWESGCQSQMIWKPNQFLIDLKEAGLFDQIASWLKFEAEERTTYRAIDMGCGSGRDAIYLKQHLQPHSQWDVTGIDNHSYALDRAASLAQKCNVSVSFCVRDLRVHDQTMDLNADLVHGCRFLDRPLIHTIRDELLNLGGLFIWSTFIGNGEEENLAPPYKESRRLVSGELRNTFCGSAYLGERRYEILHDSESCYTTRGVKVPASFFACRRIA